jgi:transposase
MYRKGFPPVHESAEYLQALLDLERNARLRPRLHLLLLIRTGQVSTRREAFQILDVHRNSVTRWLATYEEGGLKKLLRIGPRPEE